MTAHLTYARSTVRGPKFLLTAAIALVLAIGMLPMAGPTANAASAPDLGTAANFAVLAGTAVTCTDSTISGDVGVYPGTAVTRTKCKIAGTIHAGDAVAQQASIDFLDAYADLALEQCTGTLATAYTDTTLTLTPGVYCNTAGVTFTRTTLTLNGPADGIWIFKIGTGGAGALTGTNFSVVLPGGDVCNNNVYWWTDEAATLTDSVFLGSILAGTSITMTDTTFGGRALAKVAVTITDTTVVGCEGGNGKGGQACNQGVGNGPEFCDPGKSNQGDPSRSNDELGGEPGDPGRKGGNGK